MESTTLRHAAPALESDAELLVAIAAGRWRRSRAWLDPHEYLVATEQPDLYQAIVQRLKAEDAWSESYDRAARANDDAARAASAKTVRNVRFGYVQVGAWKYWLSRYPVLNRAPLPPPPDQVDCASVASAPSLEAASAAGYHLSDHTGTVWVPFQCPGCAAWHVVELNEPAPASEANGRWWVQAPLPLTELECPRCHRQRVNPGLEA